MVSGAFPCDCHIRYALACVGEAIIYDNNIMMCVGYVYTWCVGYVCVGVWDMWMHVSMCVNVNACAFVCVCVRVRAQFHSVTTTVEPSEDTLGLLLS